MHIKYILVLDAFTNGHQAALEFIKRQGWIREECELLFCGSHATLNENFCKGRLYGEPIYAVVPIQNSTMGKVSGTLSVLKKLEGEQIHFDQIDELRLHINHCLAVPAHIKSTSEIKTVISKAEALGQSPRFLTSIGIKEDERVPCDSTALGAKLASEASIEKKLAAICTKEAALHYGLTILQENIQDSPDNATIFVLLENDAYIMPKTVGIIGINGNVGRSKAEFFKKLGCVVIGSDINTTRSNADVVREAELVILCVPPQVVVKVINSEIQHSRENQLWVDMTSIKTPAARAMLRSKAQVVGVHELKAPGVGPEGQTVMFFPYRLDDKQWKVWFNNVLLRWGSEIKKHDMTEHDEYMLPVQVLQQSSGFMDIFLMKWMGVDVGKSLEFTTPFYRQSFLRMARLLKQSPSMFAGIFMENPLTIKAFFGRVGIGIRLLWMMFRRDDKGFERWAKEGADYFGTENIKKGDEAFRRSMGALNTAYDKNSIVLEFKQRDNKHGLLLRILKVFDHHKVNITGIVDFSIDTEWVQMCLNPQKSRLSESVWLSIQEIESWEQPKITIRPPHD